jgi:lysyl-tRNA synthetase class 1
VQLNVSKGWVQINGFHRLSVELKKEVAEVLTSHGLDWSSVRVGEETLHFPQFVEKGGGRIDVAATVGKLLAEVLRTARDLRRRGTPLVRHYPVQIEVEKLYQRGSKFADIIEGRVDTLTTILLRHESYEVVLDEIGRTVDLLRSLSENGQYFRREMGPVATFLPRNQPLYALALFGLIPALMAKEVHVKPPMAMYSLFRDLANSLPLSDFFPNIVFSGQERAAFVRDRAARSLDGLPITDAVIFTGTMENANRLRAEFDPRTLFVVNGAGHNPVVVTPRADIGLAVKSVIRLQLYNSGQDCANPNAVLVHRQCFDRFLQELRAAVRQIPVGEYHDREVRVGPLSDRKKVPQLVEALLSSAEYLDPDTPGILRSASAILEPTIVTKPLADGGNYTEYFAPIFFVQRYENDENLSLYFDNREYAQNAMYITVYGESAFVDNLLERRLNDGRPLHDHSTILRNTDLHAPGVERGSQPYGGYGRGASCVSINGTVTPKPTLIPRDFFEHLIEPTLRQESENMFFDSTCKNGASGFEC